MGNRSELRERYSPESSAGSIPNSMHASRGGFEHEDLLAESQELFRVSIFVFVFLALRTSCSNGLNGARILTTALIACLSLQWAILCHGLIEERSNEGYITIDLSSILMAYYSAQSSIICLGFHLDLMSLLQISLLQQIQVLLQVFNQTVCVKWFQINDVGSTLSSHLFGASFGFTSAFSFACVGRTKFKSNGKASQNVAALLLLCSLVLGSSAASANTTGDSKLRVLINSFVILCSSVVSAFVASSVVADKRKICCFTVLDGINATLVATLSISPLMLEVYGAALLGVIVTSAHIFAQRWLVPMLFKSFNMTNFPTSNLCHLTGGLVGGVASSIVAATADPEFGFYGYNLFRIYPARTPLKGTQLHTEVASYLMLPPGDGRSAGAQAGYQLLGLLVTVLVGFVGGGVTGLVMHLPFLRTAKYEEFFLEG